jgi:hypothetical protein
MATAVVVEPNATVWTIIPAIRKLKYETPSGRASEIAPPKTAENRTKNIIG